jgi:hypothetical protein
MKGRELLKLLLKKHGLTANGLVTALNGKIKQPTLHKFLELDTRESRRSTLQPVADYFKVPLEAFYDELLADKTAYQLGLVQAAQLSTEAAATIASEARAPIPFSPPLASPPSLRESLRRVRDALAHETPGVRRSVVAIMADLADRAEDNSFSDQMIDRIMGALGHQGNEKAQSSTPSQTLGGNGK